MAGYGKKFINWVAAPTVQPPYGSYGNGGAMRVIPAAFLASTLDDCLDMALRVTEITHNHPEGILSTPLGRIFTCSSLGVRVTSSTSTRVTRACSAGNSYFQISLMRVMAAATWVSVMGSPRSRK